MLLMMALPHHLKMNVALAWPDKVAWYNSIKGPMHGVKGKIWIMKTPIVDVWWDSIHRVDPKLAEIVRGALYAEATLEVHTTDVYGFGKRVHRLRSSRSDVRLGRDVGSIGDHRR